MRLLWVAVVVLLLGVGFLGLVLAGAVRRLDELRREVEELRRAPVLAGDLEHPAGGLPVGSPAPSFEATHESGGRFASSDLRGSPHLIVFADPTCEACVDLVPALLAASTAAEIPPTLVVGASGAVWPAGWMPEAGAEDRVGVVRDEGGRIARAFASDLSPHVFVVDAGGSITAQGPAGTLAGVQDLLRDGEGIQIIAGDGGP